MFVGAGSVYGAFAMSGFLLGSMMTGLFRTMGSNPINRTTILDEAFSGRILPVYDHIYGPYTKPCEGARTIACGCHSGQRVVYLAYADANLELQPIPSAEMKISLDSCLPLDVGIQSPLIQLVTTPAAAATAELVKLATASANAFIAGDTAGYVNVTRSPSSRTGILRRHAYATAADIAWVESNRFLTIATGSVYDADVMGGDKFLIGGISPEIAQNITIALDPLLTLPPLRLPEEAPFTQRVIHLLPTLEQEIHALTAYFVSAHGSNGLGVLTTVGGNSIGKSESGNDAVARFLRGVAEACQKSVNTFGEEYGGTVQSAPSIAEGLVTLSRTTGFSSENPLLLHGFQKQEDVEAMAAFLIAQPSAVLIIPFHHLALWYDTILSAVPDVNSRFRLVFATNLPNWNPFSTSAASRTPLMAAYYAAACPSPRCESRRPAAALDLSRHALRGIPQQIRLYELQCIVGRVFPPLRIETEEEDGAKHGKEEGDGDDDALHTNRNKRKINRASVNKNRSTMNDDDSDDDCISVFTADGVRESFRPASHIQTLQMMVAITSLFSRIPSAEKRRREYKRLCYIWGVDVSHHHISKMEQHCLNRPWLALGVIRGAAGHTVDRRARGGGRGVRQPRGGHAPCQARP